MLHSLISLISFSFSSDRNPNVFDPSPWCADGFFEVIWFLWSQDLTVTAGDNLVSFPAMYAAPVQTGKPCREREIRQDFNGNIGFDWA